MINVYIPTLSRWNQQQTLKYLSDAVRMRTTLVVQDQEADAYAGMSYADTVHSLFVLDPRINRIAPTRQAILEHASNLGQTKIIMFDDDLHFYVRKAKDDWHLRYCEQSDVENMLMDVMDELSEECPVVGISAREGNNNVRDTLWTQNTRIMRATAFHVPTVVKTAQYRSEVNGIEDFDLLLQMLRAGYDNKCSYFYAQGHKSANEPGGCSNWRTNETHAVAAQRLAELHPGFVKLRVQNNKTGGEFGKRVECTIYWKKARKSAGV